MYEGPIKAAPSTSQDGSPILRQLRWSDLVARLAATREMRGCADTAPDEPAASFAAFHRGHAPDGDRPVNRDALTHGKFARLSASDPATNASGGDREI